MSLVSGVSAGQTRPVSDCLGSLDSHKNVLCPIKLSTSTGLLLGSKIGFPQKIFLLELTEPTNNLQKPVLLGATALAVNVMAEPALTLSFGSTDLQTLF